MTSVETRSDIRNRQVATSAAKVFAALSDPARVARWWGPDGFTSTIHEMPFHVGGTWRLTLHGPDGANYPNEYRVLRIEQNRLLELDHPSENHHFVLTLTLTPQGPGTRVDWQQTFDTEADYQPLAGFLAQANEQVLARLSREVLG